MTNAIRDAAATPHTNATTTAGELAELCQSLPGDTLAGQLLAVVRGTRPDAAVMVNTNQLRALVSKADAAAAPKPEPEPVPEPPDETP